MKPGAGWRCVCPRCRQGRLFKAPFPSLAIVDRCAVCGLELARNDSGDGPAVFLIFILGFLTVPLALLVALLVDWPLWLHALIWSVVVLGLALGMLRPAKAGVIALQYRHRPEDYEHRPEDGEAGGTR